MKRALFVTSLLCLPMMGFSCHFGTTADGNKMILHEQIGMGGSARVLELVTYKNGEFEDSEILGYELAGGYAEALIGAGGRIGAMAVRRPNRNTQATKVATSTKSKSKSEGGDSRAKGGDAYAEGGDAEGGEGGNGYGGDGGEGGTGEGGQGGAGGQGGQGGQGGAGGDGGGHDHGHGPHDDDDSSDGNSDDNSSD